MVDLQVGANSKYPVNGELSERLQTKHVFRDFFRMPEVNSATLAHYGSVEAVKKEKQRAGELKTWVVHPYSSFRKYWLILIILASFLNVIVIPLAVSFFTEDIHYSTAWIVLNVIIDFLFITDLALNFRIGYTSHDTEEVSLDVKKIKSNYLRTWFVPDLLAVAPVDYCLLISESIGAFNPSATGLAGVRMMRLIKLSRLFSLLRLLRFSRLLRYARNWEEVNGWDIGGIATALRFLHMIIFIILVCHWNACFQFLVATLMDFPENSWVTVEGLVGKSISLQYTKAMFRSLCHMMTLNYGSIGMPKGVPELWVVITSMMVGTVTYALILARITSIVTNSRASEHVYNDKYNEVKEYMIHYRLPSSLRFRIIGHLENRYQGKWFDEDAILMELSEPLRQEVISYNCANLISSVPMFKDAGPFFISELLGVLQFEMYQTGDLIIRKGALGDCMYFINKGTVEVQHSNFTKILSDGAFFGELCLVRGRGSRRSASVKALNPCRLYCLSVQGYQRVLKRFPELKAQLDTVAQERLKNLSESEASHEPKSPDSPKVGLNTDNKVHPSDP